MTGQREKKQRQERVTARMVQQQERLQWEQTVGVEEHRVLVNIQSSLSKVNKHREKKKAKEKRKERQKRERDTADIKGKEEE